MAITRTAQLRHSPADRDTKSSSRVIAIIIRSLIIYYYRTTNNYVANFICFQKITFI
jgi:hypothetical protein